MKLFKKNILFLVALGCILLPCSTSANSKNTLITETTIGGYVIDSVNLSRGLSTFIRNSGNVEASITTLAARNVTHIYHDVTIYKNGAWVMSERYEDRNVSSLKTFIPFSAVSGDRFEVYADHYVSHNGTTEVTHSSYAFVY